MITINDKKYMSISEYAKNKGVSIQTVYNWIKEKRITVKKLMDKQFIKL
jgi:transposase